MQYRNVRMRKKQLFILYLLVLSVAEFSWAIDSQKAQSFVGQDLHLSGKELTSYQLGTGQYCLVFRDGFSMSVGANQFSSDNAVVWLESMTTEFRGIVRIEYSAEVYLQGNISVKKAKSAKTTELGEKVIEEGKSMVVRFDVSGEVFMTADKREISDPRGQEFYREALAAAALAGPEFAVAPEASAPGLPVKPAEVIAGPETKETAKPVEAVTEPKAEVKPPSFGYPVNIAAAGEVEPKIELTKMSDGTDIATVIGRFYLWQKQDERGGLMELQADNAVIFCSGQEFEAGKEQTGTADVLAKGTVKAIYLAGDVVMTEGQRTIRADEFYYDFRLKKALAINAVMRNFDSKRGVPIYVRSAKLRQLAENQFAAEDVTLTSSEFYRPQISLNTSKVIITDTTTIDQQLGKVSDSSYDARMYNIRMKLDNTTIFYWPYLRSNFERPDIPLKSIRTGYDSGWGMLVETRWYLSRLLGLQEPEGTDSTFAFDYYGRRGVGTGIEIDYAKDTYFGSLLMYLIHDSGKDKLGRHRSRWDVEPENKLRGRVHWGHRQFLPYNWQLTTGIGYASDENFVEEYYRSEYNMGIEETYVHLKHIEDNWAVSLLGKGRINDFADELEELPSAEFHLTGQSLFDDRFTLYSDTQVSRLRQRIGDKHSTQISQRVFSFVSHRTELDMPLRAEPFKVVPFVAGTFGYDDRSGFTRTLVDGSNSGRFGEDNVGLGELGVRIFPRPYWKVYPDVKSRLWDLNQLRHIIEPQLTAVAYGVNDSVVEQRDTLSLGLSQRLQTRRGSAAYQLGEDDPVKTGERVVDWMRLDTDVTWVDKSDPASDSGPGPDRFIWSRPIVPLRVLSAPEIFSGDLINDLHRFEMFGPRRNYFGADYIWRVSDTSAILSDMNFDIQSSVVQQFDIGFSHLCWPNLSYYIGSRYLNRVKILDEKGSNAFTFAATYIIDPRYTAVFSQQYDFDYGANIRSDITLIRRYHRICCSLTYSADQSIKEHAIIFSIWPQGVPELAFGEKRFLRMGGSSGY